MSKIIVLLFIVFIGCNNYPDQNRIESDLNARFSSSDILISKPGLLSYQTVDTVSYLVQLDFLDSSHSEIRVDYEYNRDFKSWSLINIQSYSSTDLFESITGLLKGSFGFEHDDTTHQLEVFIYSNDFLENIVLIDSVQYDLFLIKQDSSSEKFALISKRKINPVSNGSLTITKMNEYFHIQYIPFSSEDLWLGDLRKIE